MKKNYVEIPLLQQREIEMKILGPIVRAFASEIGEEKTFDIVRKTMQNISREIGAAKSAQHGKGLDKFKENCISMWNVNGELDIVTKEDSPNKICFDVTRCEFAELYNELGYSDIGALISCDRDAAFIDGFDSNFELVRDKTLMTGDSLCNFCYREKKD